MQSHAGLNAANHLGADRGVVDVCADVDSSEGGHDMKCESVTCGIYHWTVNLRSERRKGNDRYR